MKDWFVTLSYTDASFKHQGALEGCILELLKYRLNVQWLREKEPEHFQHWYFKRGYKTDVLKGK